MTTKLISALLLSLITLGGALSQTSKHGLEIKTIGLPLITSFNAADYDFSNQNFGVVQGDDHRMYFANYSGVLIYDGNEWDRVILPNQAAVYSILKFHDGTIYLGGVNEFGYLDGQPNGSIKYVSLKPEFDTEYSDGFISYIYANDSSVLFTAGSKDFKWTPITKSASVIESKCDNIYDCFTRVLDNSFYTFARDTLFVLENDKWISIRPTSLYKSGFENIGSLLRINDDQVVFINRHGFFDFETEHPINIDERLQSQLSSAITYDAQILHDSYILLCTWNGLVIANFEGELITHYDKETGISDNFTFASAIDNTGMLWLVSNNGIDRIDITSPYSIFDRRRGFDKIFTDFKKLEDQVIISSTSGVTMTKWETLISTDVSYEDNRLTEDVVHGFVKSGNDLITLTEMNPNEYLTNNELVDIQETHDDLYWSGMIYRHSNDLLLGSISGKLLHLGKQNGQWKVKYRHNPIFQNARHIVEGSDQVVWVSNSNEGIFKLDYDAPNGTLLNQKKYGANEGLPADENNYVFEIDEGPFFTTKAGIYRYNKDADRFEPDSLFSDLVADDAITILTQDPSGNIYYIHESLVQLKKKGNTYERIDFPLHSFSEYTVINMTAVDSSNLFLAVNGAIIHVNPSQPVLENPFKVIVTQVGNMGYPDSLFYSGFGNLAKPLSFSCEENNLSLEFSATYYNNEPETQFRWRLVGSDESWSPWALDRKKEYTNLPFGEYQFDVMAKNYMGVESAPASISFSITRPWYFTYLAYLFYVLAFCMFIWLIVKIYTRKIRADRSRLEKLVVERTKVVTIQKDQLLKMDELKSKFFLNISHELRTPLTLIMGTVERTLNGDFGKLHEELKANLNTSMRNSQRLLKMVNNILDLSKIEGGKLNLRVTRCNPNDTARSMIDLFSSKFHNKNIHLEPHLDAHSEIYLDIEKFETILINLLSNAYKFTPSGGKIKVSTSEKDDQYFIEVSDTGRGISSEGLEYVFDRFYQDEQVMSDQGTGLGLALCKELAELHHGTIEVNSKPGEGTTFTIAFLKGQEHLTDFELDPRPQRSSSARKYLLPDSPVDSQAHLHQEEVKNDGKPHILLVEDNPEMCQFVKELLIEDYHVSTAPNGKIGLESLTKIQPDLILTDYMMPEMDGFEMVRQIKEQQEYAYIPIIFLTARAEEKDRINVLNLGVDDYLAKPFNADELHIRIKNLLRNKEERSDFITSESIDPRDIEWTDFNSALKTKLDQYIDKHIKEDIQGDELAHEFAQSKRTIYRKIKVNTGLSLNQYIKEYRLRKARTMLENNEYLTVSEVSYAVGFNYLSHFTKSYKERFGKTPSEYLE